MTRGSSSANVAGIAACASDTFDPTTLTFELSASSNGQCWPWTGQVVAMVRTRYSSTASDTSSCSRGLDALRWLSWLYTNSEIDTLSVSVDVQLASSLSLAVQSAYVAALDVVQCDGTTLLITLPTVWTLNSGIAAFAQAVSAIGLCGCVVAAVLVCYHRAHPVIRSASPPFLLLSICGVCLLYVTGFLLVSSASAASCSGFQWALNFGLMLTFAPLFAKTYRIYRIFGRKKLSVVQLSNRKLLTLVTTLLAVEALLMAVWQAVGPIAPLTSTLTSSTSVNSAGHAIINQYVQCGVPAGRSMAMLAVICVEKGLLFVFGALMAFTTRRVSSTFNESQGISLAIYNLLFTVGIISPIILVISAVGDVLTLLLVFALLWIAYFTAGILFVPKLTTIYAHTVTADEVNTSVMARSSSSQSSGYQFLSLAALNTLPMLQAYQAALRTHLDKVDHRVSKMKLDRAGAGVSGGQRSTGSTRLSGALPARHDAANEQLPAADKESDVLFRPANASSVSARASPLLQPRSPPVTSMSPSVSSRHIAAKQTTEAEGTYSTPAHRSSSRHESSVLG